jgi:hypothetical protein
MASSHTAQADCAAPENSVRWTAEGALIAKKVDSVRRAIQRGASTPKFEGYHQRYDAKTPTHPGK